jgi:hypothetical protein
MIRLSFLLLILCCQLLGFGQEFKYSGEIRTDDGEPAAFATVIINHSLSNKTTGAQCDEQGKFSIQLSSASYFIKIHLIGFQELQDTIESFQHKNIHRNYTLQSGGSQLQDVVIVADRKGLAKEVIRKTIDARTTNRGNSAITYDCYIKNSVTRTTPDTSEAGKDSVYLALKHRDRPLVTYQLYLTESISKCAFEPANRFREEIVSHNDFKVDRPQIGHSIQMSIEYGEPDIVPQQREYGNNYQLKSESGYNEFNIYNRLLDIPSISEKKILSPIASGALLSYSYDLDHIEMEENTRIYVINFKAIFPGEALFTGTLHINSTDWAVVKADLQLNKVSMYFFDTLYIHQVYIKQPASHYSISDQKFEYTLADGRDVIEGKINLAYSNISIADANYKFTNERIHFADDAYDKPNEFWETSRAAPLSALEQHYAAHQDSLQKHYNSADYYHTIDSSYNRVKFLDFILFGVGFRNRAKNHEFYINPLIMQINPVGIGGYRHRLGGSFMKEFDNAFTLETDGMVDYGFRNEDVRGKFGIGLTYVPKKFIRTFVRVGDYYDMINTYASLGSLFSRSNYVRTQTLSVSQRMEVVNGLFAELTLDYSDQKPINNLMGDKWSQRLFGDVNTPISFDRYIKSEIRLDLKYKIHQKYEMRKNKKVLLGSVYPEISFTYRKGIPRLFQSEVDFDYIELKVKNETELGRLGNMEWSVMGGSFINKTNLRILEHRYFRGSDRLFFSDPLLSYQLLGPTLSTPNAFLRGNYFHHFNGIILNKIPLIRKLKLTEAAGFSFLSIPSQDFHHAEFYVGVERTIRIREELFRLGVYACTADSSWNKARIEFKLGVNFFDGFRKKWQY